LILYCNMRNEQETTSSALKPGRAWSTGCMVFNIYKFFYVRTPVLSM
jgi:hypothetical protein